MIKTALRSSTEAKQKLLTGVNILADAVAITLGARARTVAIGRAIKTGEVYERSVIDDGVKVARAIELEDEFEQMGVALVREAAQKQVDECGDGTTATIILARAIIEEAHKRMANGIHPMAIREELECNRDILTRELAKHAIPLKTFTEKIRVATVSCKNEALGALIAEVFEQMGEEAVVTVEESKSTETRVEYQKGMQFDRGYVSPYFITDPNTMRATIEGSKLLITDMPMRSIMDLVPFLEKFVQNGGRMVTIIAPEFGGDVLATFIQNRLEGKLLSLLIQAPSFGSKQKDMLSDIALLTGSTFVSEDTGHSLKELSLDYLGSASLINCTKDTTIISGGAGDKQALEERINQIKLLLADESSDFNREKYRERLAKLSNGVAVIKVGGQTEVEMKERKERVDDAVSATRAAIKEGIVPGGEVIYLAIRDVVDGILYDALKRPFYQLLANSGIDLAALKFSITNPPKHKGVDVLTGSVCNMIQAGIIDPVAVPRQAIRNAISVAIQIICTDAVIVPISEKK